MTDEEQNQYKMDEEIQEDHQEEHKQEQIEEFNDKLEEDE